MLLRRKLHLRLGMTSVFAQILFPAMNRAGEEDFGTLDMLVCRVLAYPHAANVAVLAMFYAISMASFVSHGARHQQREDAAGEKETLQEEENLIYMTRSL